MGFCGGSPGRISDFRYSFWSYHSPLSNDTTHAPIRSDLTHPCSQHHSLPHSSPTSIFLHQFPPDFCVLGFVQKPSSAPFQRCIPHSGRPPRSLKIVVASCCCILHIPWHGPSPLEFAGHFAWCAPLLPFIGCSLFLFLESLIFSRFVWLGCIHHHCSLSLHPAVLCAISQTPC